MRKQIAIISAAVLVGEISHGAQVGRYDFAGELSAHFTPVPPPMGAGATFVQSAGAMLFYNASTDERMEAIEHRHFKPCADHDWQVSVDASIPLDYDASPPPATGAAWIEVAVYAQHVDATGNLHLFVNALGIDYHPTAGPVGRNYAPAEVIRPAGTSSFQKIDHPLADLSTTNETDNLCIAYNHTNATLRATASGRELLTISVAEWQLSPTGRFDLLICGHSENQPILPTIPMRLDNFTFITQLNPALGGTVLLGPTIRFVAANLLPGNNYTVQTASNLTGSAWTEAGTFSANATQQWLTNLLGQASGNGFYRIRCD